MDVVCTHFYFAEGKSLLGGLFLVDFELAYRHDGGYFCGHF